MNHILYRRGKESGGPASAAAAAAPAFVTYASELKRLGKQAKKEQTKQENVEKTIAIQAALDKLVAQQMISLEKLRARTAETERAAAIVAKADEVEVLEAALVQVSSFFLLISSYVRFPDNDSGSDVVGKILSDSIRHCRLRRG